MSKFLLRVLMQAGRIMNNPFAINSGYVLPQAGDARSDLAKIMSDMRCIGKDLDRVSCQEVAKLDQ